MLRTTLAGTLGLAVIAAMALMGSMASASSSSPTRCKNTSYPPLHLTITRVRQSGTTCAVAHGLAYHYMRATTSGTGAHPHAGHCFGAQSYGSCSVRYRKQTWDCFHYDVVPKRTRGLVRCKRPNRVVKFNIGN